MGQICFAGCGVTCFIVITVLLLTSFKGLEATNYALTKNPMTGTIYHDSVYEGGRNFIGFWNNYIEFPATIQSMEWLSTIPAAGSHTKDLAPMEMRTQDGLMVTLDVVVQYKLIKEQIWKMYSRFQDSYENFFISNVRMGFQEVASKHNAEELWEKRLDVAEELFKECENLAKGRMEGMITCWGVQLLTVQVHQAIEDKIIERQVHVQRQDLRRTMRDAINIRAQTQVNATEYDRDIAIARATAGAEAYRIKQNAVAVASRRTREACAEGLSYIKGNVTHGGNQLSSAEIVQYSERVAMIKSKDALMLYGTGGSSASVIVGPGTSGRRLEKASVPRHDEF